jgi:hypothetical protein
MFLFQDIFNSAFEGFKYQGEFGLFKTIKYILFQVSEYHPSICSSICSSIRYFFPFIPSIHLLLQLQFAIGSLERAELP